MSVFMSASITVLACRTQDQINRTVYGFMCKCNLKCADIKTSRDTKLFDGHYEGYGIVFGAVLPCLIKVLYNTENRYGGEREDYEERLITK